MGSAGVCAQAHLLRARPRGRALAPPGWPGRALGGPTGYRCCFSVQADRARLFIQAELFCCGGYALLRALVDARNVELRLQIPVLI